MSKIKRKSLVEYKKNKIKTEHNRSNMPHILKETLIKNGYLSKYTIVVFKLGNIIWRRKYKVLSFWSSILWNHILLNESNSSLHISKKIKTILESFWIYENLENDFSIECFSYIIKHLNSDTGIWSFIGIVNDAY